MGRGGLGWDGAEGHFEARNHGHGRESRSSLHGDGLVRVQLVVEWGEYQLLGSGASGIFAILPTLKERSCKLSRTRYKL